MFLYRAYGLTICSELQLPGVSTEKAVHDVVIRLGKVGCTHADSEDSLFATPQEACFHWRPIGKLLVRQGREIVIEIAPDSNRSVLRHFLLTGGMAMLLHQRGFFVLHASAVSIHDSGVAFSGESGQGKSTTAGLFQQRGYHLITDDILPIFFDDGGTPFVFPGFFYNRLRPDAALFLGHPGRHLEITHDLPDASPIPLKRIYLLGEGARQQIDPVPPREAFIALLTHSYVGHLAGSYKTDLLTATGTATQHFQQCAQLAKNTSIFRLNRPLSLPDLPVLAELVEGDLALNRGVIR